MSTDQMPAISELKGRPIGRVLRKMRRINKQQLQDAMNKRKEDGAGGPIGAVLVEMGFVTQDELNMALAAQMGMETINIEGRDIAAEVIDKIQPQMANTYKVVPYAYDPLENHLKVAICSPDNFQATDDLQTLMGFSVTAALTTPEEMEKALAKYYPEKEESLNDLISEISGSEELAAFADRGESIDISDLREMADTQPVRRLLNLVLLQAIRDKASDVHFEPFENEYKLRYRIDGVLYEMVPPPRHIALAVTSRIKVMSNMDISERRLPQDGRIELMVNGQPVDLRVSTLPTMFGESVVMRVLDRTQVSLDLDRLGMRDQDLQLFRQLISAPNGIIICTGPTGSGKTTTLYAALNELNTIDVKIITTEDPVEYDIDGLVQVQMNEDIGLTFAKCLRSILRQDPDKILVGEIRDLETAEIAVQASLTGHLVFSTLHTNDAPSSIARLLDLDMEPYLITATLEAIVAQRLVRKICEHCKEAYEPSEEELMELNLKPEDIAGHTIYHGTGCDNCNKTGFRGRQGIFEIMVLTDDLKELIMERVSTNVLRNEARKRGMRTLRQAGLLAIFDGTTTIEEVVRETIMEDL